LEWEVNMPRIRPKPAPPSGLDAAQKAELRALLAQVEPFDPCPDEPYDLGENPPDGLLAALEYVESHGVGTGVRMRAFKCRSGWIIDSRIVADLRGIAV
jgi:hypothetical protein